MTQRRLLTRRAVCFGALAFPGASAAAPLLDTSNGGGLFSGSPAPTIPEGRWFNLFGEPPSVSSAPSSKISGFRTTRAMSIALQNANTNENLLVSLPANTGLDSVQTGKIHRFLRDWRRNEIRPIDTNVLNTLMEICGHFARGAEPVKVRITSGYRSKATNEMLRRSNANVARNSLHMQARAIDFSLPDVALSSLTRTARRVCQGGVGRYPSFIHIDSGPMRRWSV